MNEIISQVIKIETNIAIPPVRGFGIACRERTVGLSTTYNFEDGFDNKKHSSQTEIATQTIMSNVIILNKCWKLYPALH